MDKTQVLNSQNWDEWKQLLYEGTLNHRGLELDHKDCLRLLNELKKKDQEIMSLKADSCYIEAARMKGEIAELKAENARLYHDLIQAKDIISCAGLKWKESKETEGHKG
ncbi:MAG: hypothetical protein WC444_05800 [Candidatus Paceibacterota bacterium]